MRYSGIKWIKKAGVIGLCSILCAEAFDGTALAQSMTPAQNVTPVQSVTQAAGAESAHGMASAGVENAFSSPVERSSKEGAQTEGGTDGQADNASEGEDAGILAGAGVENEIGAPVMDLSEEIEQKIQEMVAGYKNLGIAHVENHLNVRETPDEKGKLVGKMPKDSGCEILDFDSDWAHIKSGKVEGYVNTEFLYMGEAAKEKAAEVATLMATVNTVTLKVRKEPDLGSIVLTMIPQGEELEVHEVDGAWVKISVDDDEGYISKEYVDISEKLNKAVTVTELEYGKGVSDVRVDLVKYAKQFIGNPYVWGGVSLTKGADCSGFVLSVFAKFGYSLPHSSRVQAGYGTKVSLAEAKPGDLIFYGSGKSVSHVAIYIGGGQVVHASSRKTGIKISNATYRTPITIRRIIKD